jgi:uncharacterized membrane protein YesL
VKLRGLIDILIRLSGVALIVYKAGVIVIYLLLSIFGADWHSDYTWGKRMEIALDPWTFILGAGLIFAPATAIMMLLGYLFMLVILIGTPILFAFVGVKLIGQVGVYVGLIFGFYIGLKIMRSDRFENVTDWLAKRAD